MTTSARILALDDMERVRTAVVGCGSWGTNVVRNFARFSDLRWCCDPSAGVRQRLAREYPTLRLAASIEQALQDPEVDAVAIATPTPHHAPMAVAALAAGKHVFVEKPLALNSTDAERAVRAAEASGRTLMVGHLLEYHPAIEFLKRLIESDELGEIYYCYTARLNLGMLRSSETVLWSLAPHDVATVLYLFDEEPIEVHAVGQAFLQNEIEDTAFITLKFSSGRIAHIHVSWLDPHKARRLTVVGARKMVTFDDMEPREKIKIFDKGVDRPPATDPLGHGNHDRALSLREGDILVPYIPDEEPLARECRAFLRAVVTGEPPRSDGRDGLRVVRVLEAAHDKLVEGRVGFQRAWL